MVLDKHLLEIVICYIEIFDYKTTTEKGVTDSSSFKKSLQTYRKVT